MQYLLENYIVLYANCGQDIKMDYMCLPKYSNRSWIKVMRLYVKTDLMDLLSST